MSNTQTCDWKCDLCKSEASSKADDVMPSGWQQLEICKTRQSRHGILRKDKDPWYDHSFDVCGVCYPGDEAIRKVELSSHHDRVHEAKTGLLRKIIKRFSKDGE